MKDSQILTSKTIANQLTLAYIQSPTSKMLVVKKNKRKIIDKWIKAERFGMTFESDLFIPTLPLRMYTSSEVIKLSKFHYLESTQNCPLDQLLRRY